MEEGVGYVFELDVAGAVEDLLVGCGVGGGWSPVPSEEESAETIAAEVEKMPATLRMIT